MFIQVRLILRITFSVCINHIQQIENEYGPVEYELGAPGEAYTKWAAQMAVGLDTGVPWVMCKQDDAPDPIVCLPGFCNDFHLFLCHFLSL